MKKKLIISVLAVLASLTCFTACDAIDKVTSWFKPNTQNSESTDGATEGEIDLAGAMDYADYMFRTSNASVREDYEVPNTLSYDGNIYPLAWTVNVPTGVTVNKQADKTIIDVNENLSEDLQYTLTLTISNPNDATDTVSVTFNRTVLAAPTKVPAKITADPVEGTAYKFYIYHVAKATDLYLNGETNASQAWYLRTTDEFDYAIDVFVEAVEGEEGQFYMYKLDDSTKTYINAYLTSDNHISNFYETEADIAAEGYTGGGKTKWHYDAEYGTMVTEFNNKSGVLTTYYLGCDDGYDTVSPQDTSANKGYLIEMVDRNTVSDADKVEKTQQELTIPVVYVGAGALNLATMGNTFPDATIAWAVSENTFASVENDQLVIASAPTEATTLTLTATISCGEATPATKELTIKVIPNETNAIIDALYALKSGESFANKVTLTGVVSAFMYNGTYNAQYGNISVEMMVAYGDTYKTIGSYRLKSDGSSGIAESQVAVGYTLTVEGILTNHNDSYQFGSGCTYSACVAGTEEDVPTAGANLDTPQKIMDAAYALATGTALEGTYTLTGTITEIDEAYSTQYSNISVVIQVANVTGNNTTILCYRMKGTGADTLKVGDTITVTGTIKNYKGTVEFDSGCTFTDLVPGEGTGEGGETETPTYTTPQEIMDAAYALAADGALTGTYTLTGVITSVDTAYSTSWKNITVTMTVNEVTGDNTSIQCYRLSGTGADLLDIGYTITVTGSISKHGDTVQFNAATLNSSVAPELTDADKVQQAIDEISIPVVYVGETTYTLPTSGKHDSAIAWTGNGVAENVLSANATEATEVTLTATVTLNEASNTKTVVVKLIPNDKAAIATAAAALQSGESFANEATLTGTVSEIVTDYSSSYNNITVNMTIAGTETTIQCYRMVGGETLAVDTVITVTGIIKNHKGTLEFDAKCTYVEGDGVTYDELTIPEAIEIGNALENSDVTTTPYYVTGTIVNIANAKYNNVYIADANGNVIYVYGVTTETTLAVGQQVKLLGVVNKYNNVAQLKETKAVEVTESTLNDAQKVLADKYVLTTTTDVKENGDVALTVLGAYGSTITWSVSESAAAVLSPLGNIITYTLPATATTVTLTATLTSGETSIAVEFNVAIAAAPVAGQLTATIDFSDTAIATGSTFASATDGNITVSAAKTDTGKTNPLAHGNGHLRLYYENVLTISCDAGYAISSITINTETGSSYLIKDDNYSLTNATITTGVGTASVVLTPTEGATSVELTRLGTSGHYKITDIIVTYVAV